MTNMVLAMAWVRWPDRWDEPIKIFDTTLVGVTPHNGIKLAITLVFIIFVVCLGWLLRSAAKLFIGSHRSQRVVFWVRQAIALLLAIVLLLGILSIWFSEPTRLATFMGLVTAGVAFALQKPISALAGYIVILRGKTFTVGDRITMGGVRGDVISLGFIQTTIMEMGQPPSVAGQEDPGMWVHARQYTGRVVVVSNSVVFDEPVYNYTKEFPYLWEEMRVPISYEDDRRRAEQILLDVANQHTVMVRDLSEEALKEMERRYFTKAADLGPRVYWRLTDNWIEMSLRFIARTHGIRDLKDAMTRDIMHGLDDAKIGIASGTYAVVAMPPLRVQMQSSDGAKVDTVRRDETN